MRTLVLTLALLTGTSAIAADWQSYPLHENGAIPLWTVVGPFPNGHPLVHGSGCFGFFTDYLHASGGEPNCVPAVGDRVEYEGVQQRAWRIAFTDSTGLLNYIEALDTDKETPGTAYAFCRIDSPVERDIRLLASSNDGIRIWLNGQLVHENHVGRTVDEGGVDRVPATLQKGPNRLLVKIDQGLGGWGQRIVLAGPNGEPLRNVTLEIQSRSPLFGRIHSAEFSPSALIAKTPQGERQIVTARILSGGLKDAVCRITKPEWPEAQIIPLGDLPLGNQRIEMQTPVITKDGPVQIVLESATDRLERRDVLFAKPRRWTVDLVQHTHTDI